MSARRKLACFAVAAAAGIGIALAPASAHAATYSYSHTRSDGIHVYTNASGGRAYTDMYQGDSWDPSQPSDAYKHVQ